ncbi:MAG: hypothetical protein KJ600_02260 [Nanoarchaeota archaeon]|nr:hypothetical protein [Nanoarchaeota archaeon]MBU1103358.1 hypothetical protein [Nanoarchaeota archaeon]
MKKADVRTAFVIGLMLAVFVLIVFFMLFGKDVWFKLLNITPEYNMTKPPIPDEVRFGYNIAQDKAKFYDGTSWMDFEEIEFNDKKINSGATRYYFAEHYFDRNLPVEFEMPRSKASHISINDELTRLYGLTYSIEQFNKQDKGEIYILVNYADYEKDISLFQYFILTPDNNLLSSGEVNEPSEEELLNVGESSTGFPIRTVINLGTAESQLPATTISHLENINGLTLTEIQDRYDLEIIKETQSYKSYKLLQGARQIGIRIVQDIEKITNYAGNEEIKTKKLTVFAHKIVRQAPSEIEIGNPEQEIRDKVSAWRDSVLSTPIAFKFENDPEEYHFCIKKFLIPDSIILTINPSEPDSPTKTCLIT